MPRSTFGRRISVASLVIFTSLFVVPRSDAALVINLNPATGMSTQAIAGFQLAANYWQSTLTDSVSVNVDIDFRTFTNPNTLGSAGSEQLVYSVNDYYNALGTAQEMTSADDTAAVANLPTLNANNSLQFRTQANTENNSAVISLDNDTSGTAANNNRFLALNTANAKAVGLLNANNAAADANIAFNSAFTWDFDNSDGIDAGHQDFVGVAIHEIGHSLGFVSGIDTVDFHISNLTTNLDDFAIFSGLDMFRYSSGDGILDLSAGTASYFSLDGGTTNEGLFSTGVSNGDGRQASHWKDNLGLGIMDPTANPPGQLNTVSTLDLRAFDVIGWDLASVPELSSAWSMLLGVGLVLGRRLVLMIVVASKFLADSVSA